MPICADPNARVYFSLDVDKDKPPAERPRFACRPLTHTKRREHLNNVNAARAETDDEKCYALLMGAILASVAGWENFPVPFSEEAMRNVLTDRELWELADGIPFAMRLTDAEKKVSGSASAADGASAPSAAAESAETSQPS
jgi:hypothetical protein